MKKILTDLFIFIAILNLFYSCEIQDTIDGFSSLEQVAESGSVVEENTQIQIKVGDVFENVNNLVGDVDIKSASIEEGPTITKNENTYNLDFNDVNGYSGVIVVEFSGVVDYSTPNLKAIVTCEYYIDNGLQIDGVMEFIVSSSDPNGLDEFLFRSIEELDLIIDDNSFKLGFDFQIKQDKSISSDKFYLFAGLSQQIKDGITNQTEILEDLYRGVNCSYPKFGVVRYTQNVTTSDEYTVTADYGVNASGESTNECDAYVKLSLGSVTTIINMD